MILSGDGRADSPGYSAKYGTYSMIELSCNKITTLFSKLSNYFRVMKYQVVITWRMKGFEELSSF